MKRALMLILISCTRRHCAINKYCRWEIEHTTGVWL